MRIGPVSRGFRDLVSRAMPTICQGPLVPLLRSMVRAAECVSLGEIMLSKSLVYDADFHVARGVGVVDGAARYDGDAGGLKVLARDAVENRYHVLFGRCSVA